MLPITTLKILNRHLKGAEKGKLTNPKKYTYMYEALKQIKQSILLEFKVINRQLLN